MKTLIVSLGLLVAAPLVAVPWWTSQPAAPAPVAAQVAQPAPLPGGMIVDREPGHMDPNCGRWQEPGAGWQLRGVYTWDAVMVGNPAQIRPVFAQPGRTTVSQDGARYALVWGQPVKVWDWVGY